MERIDNIISLFIKDHLLDPMPYLGALEEHITNVIRRQNWLIINDNNDIPVPGGAHTYMRFISQSRLPELFAQTMNTIFSNYVKMETEAIQAMIVEEMKGIKRLAISENILVNNWATELEDDEPGAKFKMSVFRDNRTSPQCIEIDDKQGDGMLLDDLKALIHEVAVRYEPKYEWRDWDAHFYCRSTLVRVL